MKKNIIISAILGLFTVVSFQNCSQGHFESSSQSTSTHIAPNKTVVSDDQIQHWLNEDRLFVCPAVRCMAPPEGCSYEQENTTAAETVANRCPSGCGKLVCDRQAPIIEDPPMEPIACPMIACSPVPVGCERVAAATTVKDSKGCDLNCGEIKCEKEGPQPIEPIMCPMVLCAAPPEGCFYRQASSLVGSRDCPGCGELICKKLPFEVTLPVEPNASE